MFSTSGRSELLLTQLTESPMATPSSVNFRDVRYDIQSSLRLWREHSLAFGDECNYCARSGSRTHMSKIRFVVE